MALIHCNCCDFAIDVKEMAVKYKRLADAYAQLKSDNSVLKKGVLDFQEKNKELEKTLQIRGNELRVLVDRNNAVETLAKSLKERVAFLQNALENVPKNYY